MSPRHSQRTHSAFSPQAWNQTPELVRSSNPTRRVLLKDLSEGGFLAVPPWRTVELWSDRMASRERHIGSTQSPSSDRRCVIVYAICSDMASVADHSQIPWPVDPISTPQSRLPSLGGGGSEWRTFTFSLRGWKRTTEGRLWPLSWACLRGKSDPHRSSVGRYQ